MSTVAFWCEAAWLAEGPQAGVRVVAGPDGRTIEVTRVALPGRGDSVLRGLVLPGLANAHSHAFHRALRGRTHGAGGTFWSWRERMYDLAAALDPERLYALALATYSELARAGWTAVGEFHYLHHDPAGRPYPDVHAMSLALRDAAADAGIRLALLDVCYLAGGFRTPPTGAQVRFSDGSAAAWARRVEALAARSGSDDGFRLATAIHSVRAVPEPELSRVVGTARALGPDTPLHVHVSEQPAENEECRRATGLSPAGLLARHGCLGPTTTAVHAGHLSDDDVALLAEHGVTVVACPTTEADLGDGPGRARDLADAGVPLALGSDQHAVTDPFLEARALEHTARSASGRRGRFSPAELVAALTSTGHRSLGLDGGVIAIGEPCDLVAVSTTSMRTAGADPAELVLAATASDVTEVVVRGRVIVSSPPAQDPGPLLAVAVEAVWSRGSAG